MNANKYAPLLAVSTEQGIWQQENFGNTDHFGWLLAGVAEEVGELSHAMLKSQQSIRKASLDDVKDAAADAIIYLMGACNTLGMPFEQVIQANPIRTYAVPALKGMRKLNALAGAIRSSGKLSIATVASLRHEGKEEFAGATEECVALHGKALILALEQIAECHGFDLVTAVCDTWETVVSKRDWKANAETGEATEEEPKKVAKKNTKRSKSRRSTKTVDSSYTPTHSDDLSETTSDSSEG